MRQRFIRKISNGVVVDLSKLNKPRLQKLHYEEEKFVAKKIRRTRPFSKERERLMRQGYDLVNTIMPWYLPQVDVSYGANEESVRLVCDFIKNKGSTQVIYEAGVGSGFSCEHLVKQPNVIVKGCDILICDKVKQLLQEYDNLQVDADTVYNSLKKIGDRSIDLFYADNVIEHLLPDEFPQTLKLLSNKMKKGGIAILIIPNRYVGPEDVSKYFVPRGEKAEGFHFMEMSYCEVLTGFKKAGIYPQYFIWRDKGNHLKYVKDLGGILNGSKILLEFVFGKLIKKRGVVERFFNKMALKYYILVKK